MSVRVSICWGAGHCLKPAAYFDYESGADLFHAQQDASRWLGPTLAKRITTAEKQKAAAETAHKKPNSDTLPNKPILMP